MRFSSAAGLALLALPGNAAPSYPIKVETKAALNSRLANVHVDHVVPVEGNVTYTYGSCDAAHTKDSHHIVGRSTSTLQSRLVWVIPEDVSSGGCISAWSDENGRLLGRSSEQHFDFHTMRRREELKKRSVGGDSKTTSIKMDAEHGIDSLGAWFEGVKLLKEKDIGPVDVKKAKNKDIAIVGGGMSGLMTYLVLKQAGMKKLQIIEASKRLGGRVHTEYLSGGPFDYSYQEMGPMRFPTTINLNNETLEIADSKIVFQLIDEMNNINKKRKDLKVDIIPWIQSSPNGLYYHNGIRTANGLPPTVAETRTNSSLVITKPLDESTQELQSKVAEYVPRGGEFYEMMAKNMFKAHREWIDNGLNGLGGDQWSEFAFMVNYLKGSLNDTDHRAGSAATTSFWDELYEGMYFSSATWSTIDGGLNRIPLSFHPTVDKDLTLGRQIERVSYSPDKKKVTLESRSSFKDKLKSSTHDYAVIAVPFSVVKRWRLTNAGLGATISNAISRLPYMSACKVALEYKTRFWEHLDNPIIGSCSTSTDIPGIGSVCYPSYNINGTGKGSILASYVSGPDLGQRWASVPEEEHVAYVQNAMVEIHGEVARKQYTGKYSRVCWLLDPLESGGWASPAVGQHELYLPEYFKTHNNMIFVGEHTSFTHAWIAAALESGIRGGVQLLLELGLVDEAKATVDKWMARWIDV